MEIIYEKGTNPNAHSSKYPRSIRSPSARNRPASSHRIGLPESIGFRRSKSAPAFGQHLYVEVNGEFHADLGTWEVGVLAEELARPDCVAWLRNVDRQAWSLEIPYEEGVVIRPMFPDLLVARKSGKPISFDILEPHDSTRGDNVPKAVGLAKFSDKHGHLFGHIELIRKNAGGEKDAYLRLDVNDLATRREVLLVTTRAQLDQVFMNRANTR